MGESELAIPEHNWDLEKTNVSNELTIAFQVKPRTPEERDLLILSKGLYIRTRAQVQPFFDRLFEDSPPLYFKEIALQAYLINSAMRPKRGDVPPTQTLEEMFDQSSIKIVADVANHYDQIEQGKSTGLTEIDVPGIILWKNLGARYPKFLKSAGDLDEAIREAKENGATVTKWLNGIRLTQAKLHNQLNSLDKQIKDTEDDQLKNFDERINQAAMQLIDDLEFALPFINKYEWRERFQNAQVKVIDFLEEEGISRSLPKLGQDFDHTWQMANAGKGAKIVKVVRGAFIDQLNGKVLQEAWVELDA